MLTALNSSLSNPALPLPGARAASGNAAAASDRVELNSSSSDTPPAPKKWTILLWSASDNDLKRFMLGDLDEAEQVGSDANTNIVAQFDHGGSVGAKRYLISQDDQPGLHSPVVGEPGRTNMSDPHNLAEFIKWGMQTYPAENYMLVISDHGDGWKGCAQDWSHNGWMDLPTVEAGLKEAREATGRKLDVLGFDACLMASAEVAHQLKDEASYLVASEETEGGDGWPYTRILNPNMLSSLQGALQLQWQMGPREVCQHVVRTAKGKQDDLPTMSATDLSKVPELTAAVDNFAGAILNTSTSMSVLKSLADKTQQFTGYRDLYDFAERVRTSWRVRDPELKAAAKQVMEKVQGAVLAEEHSSGYPRAHGLTVELSETYNLGDTARSYGEVKFAQETRWKDAVSRIRS